MEEKSICGCMSYNLSVTPHPYTHPIRPNNIGILDVRKHELSCDIAKSLQQEIDLVHQSLDSVSDVCLSE